MAWSDPGDFTSGQILTAAQMDSIREAMFFGQATFTNETARDAAFAGPLAPIALQEGMRAYLTAPTTAVVDATGAITAIPSGILTVYNGSVWVCVTPVGAASNTAATTTSAPFVTTLTGDGTALSVKLVTGTTAYIEFGLWGSVTAGAQMTTGISVSGATTLAASNNTSVFMGQGAVNLPGQRSWILTGLTAGANTFTLNYGTSGGTASYQNRWLTVRGVA